MSREVACLTVMLLLNVPGAGECTHILLVSLNFLVKLLCIRCKTFAQSTDRRKKCNFEQWETNMAPIRGFINAKP